MNRSWALLLMFGVCLDADVHGQILEEPVPKTEQPAPRNNVEKRPRRHRHRADNDIVHFGRDLVLKAGQECDEAVVIGGSAKVDGTVNGNLVVIMGSATLGTNASVRHNAVVIGGALDADPAQIGGEHVAIDLGAECPGWHGLRYPVEWLSQGLLVGRPLPHKLWWSWAAAGVFLLLYLLTALLFPRSLQTCVDSLATRPGSAFFTGLLAFGLFVPLVVLLLISVIGIAVVPFLVCAFIASLFFGKMAVYSYAGQQLGGQTHVRALQRPLLALLGGTLLFYLLYTVPVLGLLVWSAMAPLAVGAVLLTAVTKIRRSGGAGVAASSASVLVTPGGVSGAAAPSQSADVLVLPRVGFWLRLLAALLDVVLVGLIVSKVFHWHKAVVPMLFVYHVVMWTWKGTTIGGLLFNLKIVRTDGRPINFAVAVVRALAAFLSAAALFLGFFWAGWTREKQSWHDKIAGTVIVKLRPGMSTL
jgi:uncharacterized RDD family membrane protein YckC